MKTGMHAWLARVALLLVAIAAWGTGAGAQSLSGKYGGDECPYELTFAGKGVVYITTLGMTDVRGQYKVDGDKVLVSASGWPGAVFTRKGSTLETAFMGETLVCTKVSAAGSARPHAGQAPAAARTMSAADHAVTELVRAAIDSHWVKGPDGWTSQYPYMSLLYRQFREIKFTIEPEAVSEAQRLNGTDYRGSIQFANTPYREYPPDDCELCQHVWSDWRDGNPGTLRIERRGGEWRIETDADLFKGLKPDTLQVGGPCSRFSDAYNTNNICFDTRPIPLTPSYRGWEDVTGHMGWSVALPVPAGNRWPGITILLARVSRDGQTLEAREMYLARDPVSDAALDMTRKMRWNPAQKNGEAVEAWVELNFEPLRATPPSPVGQAATGFITVNVSGRAGEVYIDNVAVGGTPLFNYRVGAGRHTIRVRAGYRTWEETVQVDSGTTVVKSYDATGR